MRIFRIAQRGVGFYRQIWTFETSALAYVGSKRHGGLSTMIAANTTNHEEKPDVEQRGRL
jgi:hypothetical protein